MKISQLIAILAQYLVDHGDHLVFISPVDLAKPYREITNCWYNHGGSWGDQDRVIISGKE